MTALFMGMVSVFLRVVFRDVSQKLVGFISASIMMFSAAVML
jgi:hypothetical protein